MEKHYLMLYKKSLKAFTLLECLISLLVIAGAIEVYQCLTQVVSAHIHYLNKTQERDWLLFCHQFRSELIGVKFDSLTSSTLYVSKGEQALAFGKTKTGEFRKSNANGKGYQPMLFHLKYLNFSQQERLMKADFIFKDGTERTFIYDFETTD